MKTRRFFSFFLLLVLTAGLLASPAAAAEVGVGGLAPPELHCEAMLLVDANTGKAVFDPERERQKLDAVAALAHSDFNSRGIREGFSCLMDISKERQYRLLEQSGVRADGGDTKACTGGEN